MPDSVETPAPVNPTIDRDCRMDLAELMRQSRHFHGLRAEAHAPGALIPVSGADHFRILDALKAVATEVDSPPARVALAWTVTQARVDALLPNLDADGEVRVVVDVEEDGAAPTAAAWC